MDEHIPAEQSLAAAAMAEIGADSKLLRGDAESVLSTALMLRARMPTIDAINATMRREITARRSASQGEPRQTPVYTGKTGRDRRCKDRRLWAIRYQP